MPACLHTCAVSAWLDLGHSARTLSLYRRQEVCSSMCLPVGSGTHPCCTVYGNVMKTLICLQRGVWLLRLTWLTLALWRLELCRHTSAVPHASTDTVLTTRRRCEVDRARPLPMKKALPCRLSRQELCWLTERSAATALLEGCPGPGSGLRRSSPGCWHDVCGKQCRMSQCAHGVRTAC